MKCTEVSELLPWLVTGRLEEGERARVEGHLEECGACRAELEEVVALLRSAAQHVPAEALIAFARHGSEAGPERQDVVDHLAHCTSCQVELGLVRESFRSSEGGGARSAQPWSVWRPLALVASVACVLLAGGWLLSWWSLSTQLAGLQAEGSPGRDPRTELEAIRTDLQVVELLPEEVVLRGSRHEEATLVLGAGSSSTVLLLLTDDATRYGDLRVELRDATNRTLWEASGLSRQAGGEVALLVPSGTLTAEPLLLTLFGQLEGQWEAIGSYRVAARDAPD